MAARNFKLFLGCLGNGVTVCNSAVMEGGDFKMVAHISNEGKITWYVGEDYPPADALASIRACAEQERAKHEYLRNVFASQLITGPFSILVGFNGGMMALNDRLKLRSMVVAETEDIAYVASEECAIRVMAPDVTNVWSPRGGEPVIFTRKGGRA